MFGIQEIDAPELLALMEDGPESFLLVDVRNVNEELRSESKVVFYCQTGARSGQVCGFLQQHGFDHVFNLRGGIVDWYRRGYTVEAPRRSRVVG